MDELSGLIQQVAQRSRALRDRLAIEVAEKERLQVELSRVISENARTEERLRELEQEVVRLRNQKPAEVSVNDLNERIDELVREIDECVLHLKR
jgi:predicted nuclease with TOPRIM domain